MKLNRIKTWLAVLCLGALASNASAVTINTNQVLGRIIPGTPANPANETEMVRFLVAALNTGSSGAVAYSGAGVNLGNNPADGGPEVYTLWDPVGVTAGSAPLPLATGTQTVTSNVNINLGAFVYDWILAKFGQDSVVFYIGNLSGAITIPNLTGNRNGLSGYLLVNKRDLPQGNVPDGGATVALLGLSLAGMAMVRRFNKKA